MCGGDLPSYFTENLIEFPVLQEARFKLFGIFPVQAGVVDVTLQGRDHVWGMDHIPVQTHSFASFLRRNHHGIDAGQFVSDCPADELNGIQCVMPDLGRRTLIDEIGGKGIEANL